MDFNWGQKAVELKEELPGIFVDVSSVNSLLDVSRKGWISPVYDFRLKNFAEYLGRRRDFNVLVSPLSSRAYLLPHQLAVTEKVTKGMAGRAILADEVGLGKTIESGMIMKELVLRGLVNKVLILVPASLTTQWHEEMRYRFNENFELYDSDRRKQLEDQFGLDVNIWDLKPRIIASLHAAKQKRHRDSIQAIAWDLVIVDEAHRLKNSATQNHKLVQALKTRYLLMLTATPLQNFLVELYNIVSLVDRELLGAKSGFKRRFEERAEDPAVIDKLKKRLRRVMIRNRRSDVGDTFTFNKRQAMTVQVNLDGPNRALYNLVTRYALEGYQKSVATRNTTYGFFVMLVQRMLTSSLPALQSTLEKRLEMLKEVRRGNRKAMRLAEFIAQETEVKEIEDDEVEKPAPPPPSAEQVSVKPLEEEIAEIEQILKAKNKVTTHPKLDLLHQVLAGIYKENPGVKVVIFTEFRSTQDFLAASLKDTGYDVEVFHGGMNAKEKDEAVERFEEEGQILVSTEAGGEGRNLQFSHIVINYDLPWNPMKVEQRIGRVHRIGQKHDVQIVNFSTKDTVEEYLLRILENKIGLFKEVLGELEAILGLVSGESSFEQLIMDLLSMSYTGDKTKLEEAFRKLEERIDQAKQQAHESLLFELYNRGVNLSLKDRFEAFKDYTPGLEQTFLHRFIEEYLDKYNALTDKSEEHIAFKVPGHLASGFIFSDYIRGTVSREVALAKPYYEFIGVGHNFVDAAIRESRGLLPMSIGMLTRDTLVNYGVINPREQGLVASFLAEYEWSSGLEERFYTAFTDGDQALVLEALEEPFLYMEELPPHFLSDLPVEVYLEKITLRLKEVLIEKRKELLALREKEAGEVKSYIQDYYSDLRYDFELQLEKIAAEFIQLKRRKMRLDWSETEGATGRERVLKAERTRLFTQMIELNAREKTKISEVDSNTGISARLKLLSLAKVQIL